MNGFFSRRGHFMAGVIGAVVAGGLLLGGCGDPDRGVDSGESRVKDGRWAEGVTPAWMAEHMKIDVPATAKTAQAAYHVQSQFDTGLLTFTLTRAEAEDYLKKNPPEGMWLTPEKADPDTRYRDFTQLGLPEPETFKDGMRYGTVCAGDPVDDPYGTQDGACVKLYAHEYAPDRTRIYIRDYFEPGISPLPDAPKP
ncbi:hypothetical protein [Streptomyces sp. NPDC048623]|uniref:hypothetical protein n=1 Tax=Streptomyces sp. NPDC048623 TaxID=3155761 RepID=UPI00344518B3